MDKLSTSPAKLIDQLLTQEESHVSQLIEALEKERRALEQRQWQELQLCSDNKQSLVEQLQRCHQQRLNLLQHWKAPGEWPNNWRRCLMAVERKHPQLVKRWRALEDQLRRGQQLNEINGRIIQHSQISTGKLLSILKGQNDSPALYSAKGRKLGAMQSAASSSGGFIEA